MIIIFSNSSDHSTSHVIDWLHYFNVEYIRVNFISEVEILNYDSNKNTFIFKYNKQQINSANISGFWYRRGLISVQNISLSRDLMYNNKLNNFLRTEKETLYNYFVASLERNCKNSIGGYFNSDYNKLFQLEIAKKCGLKIPESFILNSPSELKSNERYITKSLDTVFDKFGEKHFLMNYTNLINQDKDIIKYASFIQKCVDKKFEIRAFFLNGDLYSMAIFSQNNSQTNIDFRHYDYDLPNRNIPFKFPQKISNQISTFMKAINLNCGSLDFIYSKNKEFIFLEVNPVGQFGMTSQPCNYNLEKIIATTLLKDEK